MTMNVPIRPKIRRLWEVGADLGSTYSAVGYYSTMEHTREFIRPQDVKKVANYPRGAVFGSGKSSHYEIPTEVFYAPDGEGWETLIGFSAAKANEDRNMDGVHMSLFKPFLHDDYDTESRRSETAAKLARLPGAKTVDRVVTDFLEQLMRHAKTQMIKYGGYDESEKVHLGCTVPSMWPLRAKRRILKAYSTACGRAGLPIEDIISIWSEPEAATAYILGMVNEGEIDWEVKETDTFTLLDAGGITMDIVTYKILSLSPLKLAEVVQGGGTLCGAMDLNKRFVEQVRGRLRDARQQLEAVPNSKTFEELMRDVDQDFQNSIKTSYDGNDRSVDYVRVQGLAPNPSKGFGRSDIRVTSNHLELVFSPVLDTAWGLVQHQLDSAYHQANRNPNRLICVGGLTCSPRFRKDMEHKIDYYVKRAGRDDIKCIFTECSDFAIAAGAIYRSLNECVVEDYISRSSIAIVRHVRYNKDTPQHKDAIAEFDRFEQKYYVLDCVHLLLKPDEVIPSVVSEKTRGIRRTANLYETFEWDSPTAVLSTTIMESDSNEVAEGFPRQHEKNKGFHDVDTVSFNLDIAKLRAVLPKRNTKDETEDAQLKQQRKSSRQKKGNPRRGIEPPSTQANGDQPYARNMETSPSTPTSNSLIELDRGIDYMHVDYLLEVEFKGVFMEYVLKCPDTGESVRGQVSLSPNFDAF